MNRRSFFAAALAAPLAAVVGLKKRLRGGHYEMIITDDIMDNRCGETPITFENIWKMIDEFEDELRPASHGALVRWDNIIGRPGT